jgi:protein arginine kinase activator
MLCDNCKERDAVINLTQVEHDSKVTLHLCEQCAQQKGVETGGTVLKSPLGGFLTALGKGGTGAALLPSASDGLRCSACGATLRDFRDSGRLGCDQCYLTFDFHLRDLLRRLHGSSQHVGERYELPGADDADPKGRLLELRAQLRRAVESENFELAAELRDRLRVLE